MLPASIVAGAMIDGAGGGICVKLGDKGLQDEDLGRAA
jgi:hypothetical protein